MCKYYRYVCALFLTHAANEVTQAYPKNRNYCCHCPNIELICIFSEPPLIAFWTVNGTSVPVTDSTPGHTARVSNGALVLKVSEARYSSNTNYTCIAEYGDETVKSMPFTVPKAEGLCRLCNGRGDIYQSTSFCFFTQVIMKLYMWM